MELSNFILEEGNEGYFDPNRMYMKHSEMHYKVLVKIVDLESGMREVNAYRDLPYSPLLDFEVVEDGVKLMFYRQPGERLSVLLQDKNEVGRLSEHLGDILFSLTNFLTTMHENGVYHGDIRPENILIDENYTAILVNFGKSSLFDNVDFINDYSEYIAPEIVLGGTVDPRLADVFSLGRSLEKIQLASDSPQYEYVDRIAQMTSVIPENRV